MELERRRQTVGRRVPAQVGQASSSQAAITDSAGTKAHGRMKSPPFLRCAFNRRISRSAAGPSSAGLLIWCSPFAPENRTTTWRGALSDGASVLRAAEVGGTRSTVPEFHGLSTHSQGVVRYTTTGMLADHRSPRLDFVCIGAQKAGTTALWRHLTTHPQLALPSDKAATFFAQNSRYERGLEWFFHEFFRGADPAARWGTVSPRYMGEGFASAESAKREAVPVEEIAHRMRAAFPSLRLIAVLRDPLERAISNYRMEVRRGFERRSFDEAVRQQLTPGALQAARRATTITEGYVVQGEYGRILSAYLDTFPRGQLLVVLSEDLAERPMSVLTSVFDHIGVDTEHRPPNLFERHFAGGLRNRVPKEAEVELRRYLAHNVWPLLGDDAESHRRAFYVWLEAWRVNPDDQAVPVSHDVRLALEEHYREDAARLIERTGLRVSWA